MRARSLGLGNTVLIPYEGSPARATFTVTKGATSDGTVTFSLPKYNNGTGGTVGFNTPVLAGDTPEQVAEKIALKVTGVEDWISTVEGATVVMVQAVKRNLPRVTPIISMGGGVTATLAIPSWGSNRVESTDMYGYYGKYTGIATPNELIAIAGITEGTTKNNAYNNPNEPITWLKFSHNYKTLFVADRVIHYGVPWNHLDSKGITSGTVIEIEGHRYLLRLLQGANSNPSNVGGATESNDEWNSLIVQFAPETEDSHWASTDVVNASIGAWTVCAETWLTDMNQRVLRGGTSVTSIASTTVTTTTSNRGFRPVLEVL